MYLLNADQLIYSLCQALMHSAWMGLLLALAAAVLLVATRRSSAQLRYLLLCGMMILFLLAVSISFYSSWLQFTGTGTGSGLHDSTSGASGPAGFFGFSIAGLTDWLMANSTWVVTGWMLVVGFKMLRLFADWMYVFRIRGTQVYGAGDYWEQRTAVLAARMGINRGVGILESALVKVPVVTGHLKPLILIPIGIINQLPAAEVEAVLLHELAHIRRGDYLVNIMQRFAELLFFFNPGLLWISSLIRDERENCCDDLAITASQDRAVFVQALVSFREYSMRPSMVAMPFPGIHGQLVHRLSRIVYNRNKGLTGRETGFVSLNLVMLVFLLFITNTPLVSTNVVNAIAGSVGPMPTVQQPFVMRPDNETTEIKKTIDNRRRSAGNVGNRKPVQETTMRVESNTVIERVTAVQQQKSPVDRKESHPGQAETDRINAERDRRQAEIDRAQAVKDRMQADMDRAQAERDRDRAEIDRRQAEKDRAQAVLDRATAEADRKLAEQRRMQAAIQREHAEADRAKAEQARAQAAIERGQLSARN